MQITGKVVFEDIEGGHWGIMDAQGQIWRPIEMPEQLKHHGQEVTVSAQVLEDIMSIVMWGTPIKLTGFHTITP